MKLAPWQGGLVIALLLMLTMFVLTALAYWGIGAQVVDASRAQHMRASSLTGPRVEGGGPNGGK